MVGKVNSMSPGQEIVVNETFDIFFERITTSEEAQEYNFEQID